jgi:hypothetical protein
MSARLLQAARNNAVWCDSVCRAHGTRGEFTDKLWLTRGRVPRFFPNAVTLAAEGQADQLAAIRALAADARHHTLSLKDSFAALDLAPLGFHILFEATWLWKPPGSPARGEHDRTISSRVVKDPAELTRWEAAWNGPPSGDPPAHPERVFLPALLADPDITFVAVYEDDRIVAGAVANRTGEVVGVSNLFAPQTHPARYWRACLAAITETFSGLPLVGYERGAEVAVAHQVGFEDLGPLRVWTNAPV